MADRVLAASKLSLLTMAQKGELAALTTMLALRERCDAFPLRAIWLQHTGDVLLRGALQRGERRRASELLAQQNELLAAVAGPLDATYALARSRVDPFQSCTCIISTSLLPLAPLPPRCHLLSQRPPTQLGARARVVAPKRRTARLPHTRGGNDAPDGNGRGRRRGVAKADAAADAGARACGGWRAALGDTTRSFRDGPR